MRSVTAGRRFSVVRHGFGRAARLDGRAAATSTTGCVRHVTRRTVESPRSAGIPPDLGGALTGPCCPHTAGRNARGVWQASRGCARTPAGVARRHRGRARHRAPASHVRRAGRPRRRGRLLPRSRRRRVGGLPAGHRARQPAHLHLRPAQRARAGPRPVGHHRARLPVAVGRGRRGQPGLCALPVRGGPADARRRPRRRRRRADPGAGPVEGRGVRGRARAVRRVGEPATGRGARCRARTARPAAHRGGAPHRGGRRCRRPRARAAAAGVRLGAAGARAAPVRPARRSTGRGRASPADPRRRTRCAARPRPGRPARPGACGRPAPHRPAGIDGHRSPLRRPGGARVGSGRAGHAPAPAAAGPGRRRRPAPPPGRGRVRDQDRPGRLDRGRRGHGQVRPAARRSARRGRAGLRPGVGARRRTARPVRPAGGAELLQRRPGRHRPDHPRPRPGRCRGPRGRPGRACLRHRAADHGGRRPALGGPRHHPAVAPVDPRHPRPAAAAGRHLAPAPGPRRPRPTPPGRAARQRHRVRPRAAHRGRVRTAHPRDGRGLCPVDRATPRRAGLGQPAAPGGTRPCAAPAEGGGPARAAGRVRCSGT